jgi:DNA polymerase-3 subunit gamma/tau
MLVRRESKTGANDLHTIYRPCSTSEMLGNQTNVNMIKKGLDNNTLSHTFLFTGDAGCGKTTMARIISLSLNCSEFDEPTSTPCLKCSSCKSILNHNSMDVIEINVGKSGGKDAVDSIVKDLPSSPFSAKHKVIIFDEAHKLTSAAQDLLLKVIEDGYSHVFFVFATNHPEKLSDTFMTRCNVMHFGRISKDLIFGMLKNVAEFEAMDYKPEILDYIAEESRGVPRNALVWLKQTNDEGSWIIDAVKDIVGISLGADDPKIIEISRELLKGHFKGAANIYDKIKNKNQAESVRIGITSYMIGCLKRAKNFPEGKKFSIILDIITPPIYEQGRLGDYKLYNYLFKVTCVIKDK